MQWWPDKQHLPAFFFLSPSSLHHNHKPPFQPIPTLKSARASDFHCTVNLIVHDFCSRQLFSLKINTKKIENPPIKPHTKGVSRPSHRQSPLLSVPRHLPPDSSSTNKTTIFINLVTLFELTLWFSHSCLVLWSAFWFFPQANRLIAFPFRIR